MGLKGTSGALVALAQKDSPAAQAGVKSGDVITAVDGETVADPHDLARKIAALGPKKTATLAIIRNGAPMTLDVTLGTHARRQDRQCGYRQRNGSESGSAPALANLGLTLRHGPDGVIVESVDPDSTASDKGLKEGDVILEVGGKIGQPPVRSRAGDQRCQDGRQKVSAYAREVRRQRALPRAANQRVLKEFGALRRGVE